MRGPGGAILFSISIGWFGWPGPLHILAARSGWLGIAFVSCALAASYGGSGLFLDARRLFDESPVRNGVFGNVVLAAYVGARK